jgi:Predicted glycosylase
VLYSFVCFLSVFFAFQKLSAAPYEEFDPLVDLETHFATPFILETKQIHVPGYPTAFNGTIIRWKGRLILGFRVIPDRKFSFTSYAGLVDLDEEFNPIGTPQLLDMRQGLIETPSRVDDSRLIQIGERLYLVYSDNVDPIISKKGFRLYIAELQEVDGVWNVLTPVAFTQFEGESPDRREKNWVPFDFEGNMLLSYTIAPHIVFSPNFTDGSCTTLYKSDSKHSWEWGELRGGTTALREGDVYLSFFHSSVKMPSKHSDGKSMPHYFMGAYTFESQPPFKLLKTSLEPIVGAYYYNGPVYKPYWGSVRVVFPCGFISDSEFIWVIYGRADNEVWVTKLDKKALLESLVDVDSN